MTWRETNPMTERRRFIIDLESDLYTVAELSKIYGVSRKTGYKWIKRYEEGGFAALADRSRAPKGCPHRMSEWVREKLIEWRIKHPTWGPRKLLPALAREYPGASWPALSTVGDLLKREGLIQPRKRRRRPDHPGRPRFEATAPNDIWSIDFKGEFRTGDKRLCYPLTVEDQHSRFLLGCKGMRGPRHDGARVELERIFQEHGLPAAILSDNGTPFSSQALTRLSRLSVWWLKLGIEPLLIELGHPEQNGRHERMHRTLKAEACRPPARNLQAQQRRFNAFRHEYNIERPHEALDQRPPAEEYRSSARPYPREIPEPEYPGHFEVRRVRRTGEIRWKNSFVFLSEVLAGETVGLEETDDGIWSVYFLSRLLTKIDERRKR